MAVEMTRGHLNGFHLTFANGFTVSVQQSQYNYADEGQNAEVAAWGIDGEFLRLRKIFEGDDNDTVIGWCDADKVARIIDFVRRLP